MAAFDDAMDALTGTRPIEKIELELDGGTEDITDWFRGGAVFDQRREIAPDRISAGDSTLTFSNHDDKFTETDAGSIFYGEIYHNRKLKFYVGFQFDDGTKEYRIQSTMLLKDVSYDFDKSLVYFACTDLTRTLIDSTLNIPPNDTLPAPDAANIGNGSCSEIATMPFATVNETWTLTCTTPGGDSVAIFSVVGSVSGNIGNATSGTKFTNATFGVKFTIKVGGTNWSGGDKFTFTTYQFLEWTNENPAKIIWSLLTGTIYDTGADENFKSLTLLLDSTRSTANTQIDWTTLVDTVGKVYTPVTGYIPQNKNTAKAIEELHILFLGSTMIAPDGRIKVKAYHPALGTPRNFADTKKITGRFKRTKKVVDIINSASCKTKRTATWAWSDDSEDYDFIYVNQDATSITNYIETRHKSYESRWLSINWQDNKPEAQRWFIDRLVGRFSIPPTKMEFITGMDALETELGDEISITDSDSDLNQSTFAVSHLKKDFVAAPKKISIICNDDATTGLNWIFWGSSADEGDGISPHSANWDSASSTDRQFCYWSTTGAVADPRYYWF